MTVDKRLSRLLKDAGRIDKLNEQIKKLVKERDEIQSRSTWTAYLSPSYKESLTSDESQRLYEASRKITYAHQ